MLIQPTNSFRTLADALSDAVESAVRAIPPAFPLSATVAVNPFLGHTGEPIEATAARLSDAAGLSVFPKRDLIAAKLAKGEITRSDIAAALPQDGDLTLDAVLAALERTPPAPAALPTVAALAGAVDGSDWAAFVADRIGAWASGHFDRGQALWPAVRGQSDFDAWRTFAMHDLTPEIAGLAGFAGEVAHLPVDTTSAVVGAAETLGLPEEAAQAYFLRLLHDLGGWAQIARWRLWQAELDGRSDRICADLLAVRLVWEAALLRRFGDRIGPAWTAALVRYATPPKPTRDHAIDAVLLKASELATQRQLASRLDAKTSSPLAARPALQAAFCIDVRSEVFRRALESLDPGIETIGFAGFFGLPLAHRALGSAETDAHLPVLIKPGVHSASSGSESDDRSRRILARTKRALGRFRQAAVSSFAFVEAAGPVYAGKLVAESLKLGNKGSAPEPEPAIAGLSPEAKIDAAATILRAMSLGPVFAPVVLLLGHGANVRNNLHASALHCGACGGQTGEVSARALAGLLNDPEVRQGLHGRGIEVPSDTIFVGGLHDTTTDAVTLFDADADDEARLGGVRDWLARAGAIARATRAPLLPRSGDRGARLFARAADWSEVRPEWGLAGCSFFIAAPRDRTQGLDLAGRAFLHSYDWHRDEDFGVLELILTAPVVVASWISLQYYGSVVAPEAFGGGNKLLHNAVGGFGVLEGNGGAPRVGLPIQSVHDGANLRHDPMRLTVMVEAPAEAISDILARHPGVQDLFDNQWLHLLRLDGGRVAERYVPQRQWTPFKAAWSMEGG